VAPARVIRKLFGPPPGLAAHRDLTLELAQRAFRSSRTGILTTTASAIFFAVMSPLWVDEFWRPGLWLLLSLLAVGLRIVLDRACDRQGIDAATAPMWINRLTLVIFLSSLITAAIVPFLWSDQVLVQFALLLVMAVHAMLGAMNHTAVPKVVAAHLLAVALMVSLFLLAQGEQLFGVLGVAAAGFTLVCYVFAIISRRLMIEAISQRLDAEAARDDAVAASLAKSRFLATMSHELRTPLNAIIGFAGVLHRDLDRERPQHAAYATQIERAGSHLLRLINDILDMSKIEAGRMEIHPEWIPIEEILADCKAVLRQESHQAEIEYRTGDAPARLWADLRATLHILINLLSNAVKFTPKDGKVICTISGDHQGGVTFTITDTGIGMAEADLSTALEPFGQIDSGYNRRFQGTGLGLPIVKALTELHGGRFAITSTPGRGTEVVVWLPPKPAAADTPGA